MRDFLTREAGSSGAVGLIVLISVIAVLLVGTLLLSTYAIVVRARHATNSRETEARTERWRGPVLGAVTDPALIPSVQALVTDGEEIHFLSFVIEYARRVRGAERAVLRDLVQPFLPHMVERLHSRRTEMRAWAVQTLGTLGLPQYADEVALALDDPSPLVAMVAARALAREETPEHAGVVLARLHRFTDWNRQFLAAMLATMGPDVSEALRAGLANDDSPSATRAVMAEALRLQGDFVAGDIAADIVGNTDDRELLASCLRLLAAVGRPEHAGAVRPHCASDDIVVRAQAFRALGPLGSEADVPLLVAAMDDPSPWPALYAARGARDAGGKGVLEEMVASGHPSSALAKQVMTEAGR